MSNCTVCKRLLDTATNCNSDKDTVCILGCHLIDTFIRKLRPGIILTRGIIEEIRIVMINVSSAIEIKMREFVNDTSPQQIVEISKLLRLNYKELIEEQRKSKEKSEPTNPPQLLTNRLCTCGKKIEITKCVECLDEAKRARFILEGLNEAEMKLIR